MKPLVQQAIDLWGQKVGEDIAFRIVTDSPDTPADVTITWVAPDALPTDSVGRTMVQYRTANQSLTSAAVTIQESLPDSFQVQVITHELGHALGIDGHSQDKTDLMYANAHLPTVVTPSDQNTVRWSYEASQTSRSRSAVTAGTVPGAHTGIASIETVCGLGK